jgi:hypothetical protein
MWFTIGVIINKRNRKKNTETCDYTPGQLLKCLNDNKQVIGFNNWLTCGSGDVFYYFTCHPEERRIYS